MRGAGRTLALAALAVFLVAPPSSDAQQRGFSNNPCDHEAPDGVTCKMGLEELCKGTFSLWAMYATRLGQPPDTNMTCCTASVFSSECTSVCRGMMQLLRVCPMFRNMKNNLPEGTDTDPSIAHELCDTCLYETPGDINSVDKPLAAALRDRLEVFPGDASGKKRAISF